MTYLSVWRIYSLLHHLFALALSFSLTLYISLFDHGVTVALPVALSFLHPSTLIDSLKWSLFANQLKSVRLPRSLGPWAAPFPRVIWELAIELASVLARLARLHIYVKAITFNIDSPAAPVGDGALLLLYYSSLHALRITITVKAPDMFFWFSVWVCVCVLLLFVLCFTFSPF